jgi:hypothetical protein
MSKFEDTDPRVEELPDNDSDDEVPDLIEDKTPAEGGIDEVVCVNVTLFPKVITFFLG